jgi:4-alpha-glucanotransferase
MLVTWKWAMDKRGSGILLYVTSLPSPFGIGDLGPWAFRFVDFLEETKQRYWQILPLNPTNLKYGNSPYHSNSVFAGETLLISPELLVQDGLLDQKDLELCVDFPKERVDYPGVISYKNRLFQQAFARFKKTQRTDEYERFCQENIFWLEDYALFTAISANLPKQHWIDWPVDLLNRVPEAVQRAKESCFESYEKAKFLQYLFWKQWMSLQDYCRQKGIRIIGDIPIYPVYDSADLWVYPELFNLDENRRPITVAGVPPDYFSETGQLWGNPVYRWDILKDRSYDWWIHRFRHNLTLYDLVRVDHFRGFVGYWEVPAHEKNAVNGNWSKAPAEDFFNRLLAEIPNAPIIAEDLGTITPDVKEILDHFEFPGMKVLLFAFSDDLATNPYVPHNHVENCVVYTGTHDNNTVLGWFQKEASPEDKKRISMYLGRDPAEADIHWELIRLGMMSVARIALFPMQDILGLGEEARMNRPGTRKGNWQWRFSTDQLTPVVKEKLREMTKSYGRV